MWTVNTKHWNGCVERANSPKLFVQQQWQWRKMANRNIQNIHIQNSTFKTQFKSSFKLTKFHFDIRFGCRYFEMDLNCHRIWLKLEFLTHRYLFWTMMIRPRWVNTRSIRWKCEVWHKVRAETITFWADWTLNLLRISIDFVPEEFIKLTHISENRRKLNWYKKLKQ